MSINNSMLPKLSTSLFWLVVISYGFLLLLNFLTGFAQEYLVHATGSLVLLFVLLRRTRLLLKFSTNTDYLEFATGHFFSLDEMSIKSNLVRVVKSDIEEIEYKGFLFWKRLRFKMNEDGKRYFISMPLRFVPATKAHFIIEDIIGMQEENVIVAMEEVPAIQQTAPLAA